MYDDNVALQGPLPYSSPCILHNRHRFCGVGMGELTMGGCWGGVGGGGGCRNVIECVYAQRRASPPSLQSLVHMGRFNKGPR